MLNCDFVCLFFSGTLVFVVSAPKMTDGDVARVEHERTDGAAIYRLVKARRRCSLPPLRSPVVRLPVSLSFFTSSHCCLGTAGLDRCYEESCNRVRRVLYCHAKEITHT